MNRWAEPATITKADDGKTQMKNGLTNCQVFLFTRILGRFCQIIHCPETVPLEVNQIIKALLF